MNTNLTLSILFFLSGLTSLVYQSLWIRVLSLGVGSTSTSISIVLAIFFLGLSLGSLIAGKFSDRIKKPMALYGWLEGVIGVFSFFLIYILFEFHQILAFFPLSGSLSWLGLILKFSTVFLFLIIPATLMGASLPILIKIFVKDKSEIGKKISYLYGINTFGAVAGAFLTGFFFIPAFGVLAANHGTVLVNILIMVVALYLQKGTKDLAHSVDIAPHPTQKNKTKEPYETAILYSTLITGFAALTAEVVWNKYLGIFLGSNIFGLSLVLCVFLFGLAIGSIALSLFIHKIKNKYSFYLWLMVFTALSIYATSKLLSITPLLTNLVYITTSPWLSFFNTKALVCTLILFPSSSLLGVLLPLAISLLVRNPEDSSRESGKIYAYNTVGSIFGSCITGLLLIPALGSGTTLKIAGILLVLTSGGLLFAFNKESFKKGTLRFSYLAVLALIVFTKGISFEQVIHFAYEQENKQSQSVKDIFTKYLNFDEEFKFIYEGQSGIITMSHDAQDGERYKEYYRLKTNGLNESIYNRNNMDSLPKYEALLGFLPVALARNPDSAFIVGYGGGYTVNFLSSTGMRNVQVAELEKGILEAAKFAQDGVMPFTDRKNLKISVEDARFVLAAKLGGPFDIIVSQPSHSWLTGVANLFTAEYFEIVKQNLTEEGVFSQWLNLYNMDEKVLSSILKTFYQTFPHGMVFTGNGDQELIMIGAKQPVNFDMDKLSAMLRNKKYAKFLEGVPLENAYQALSLFTVSRADVIAFTKDAQINTDRNAYAEVLQSRLFYEQRPDTPNQFLLRKFSGNYEAVVNAKNIDSSFYDGILRSIPEDFYKYNTLVKKMEEMPDQSNQHKTLLAFHMVQMERYASALEILRPLMNKNPSSMAVTSVISALLRTNQEQEALKIWNAHNAKITDIASRCYNLEIFTKNYLWTQAAAAAKDIQGKNAEACGLYGQKALGFYYWKHGNFAQAIPFLEYYYGYRAKDAENYQALTALYLLNGQVETGLRFAKYLETALNTEKSRVESLMKFFEENGLLADAEALRKKYSSLYRE